MVQHKDEEPSSSSMDRSIRPTRFRFYEPEEIMIGSLTTTTTTTTTTAAAQSTDDEGENVTPAGISITTTMTDNTSRRGNDSTASTTVTETETATNTGNDGIASTPAPAPARATSTATSKTESTSNSSSRSNLVAHDEEEGVMIVNTNTNTNNNNINMDMDMNMNINSNTQSSTVAAHEDILRSLQETEIQRMNILNTAATTATTATTTTHGTSSSIAANTNTSSSSMNTNSNSRRGGVHRNTGTRSTPGSGNSASSSSSQSMGTTTNPEDAIKGALALLRRHRPSSSDTTRQNPNMTTGVDVEVDTNNSTGIDENNHHNNNKSNNNNNNITDQDLIEATRSPRLLDQVLEQHSLNAQERQSRMAHYTERLEAFKQCNGNIGTETDSGDIATATDAIGGNTATTASTGTDRPSAAERSAMNTTNDSSTTSFINSQNVNSRNKNAQPGPSISTTSNSIEDTSMSVERVLEALLETANNNPTQWQQAMFDLGLSASIETEKSSVVDDLLAETSFEEEKKLDGGRRPVLDDEEEEEEDSTMLQQGPQPSIEECMLSEDEDDNENNDAAFRGVLGPLSHQDGRSGVVLDVTDRGDIHVDNVDMRRRNDGQLPSNTNNTSINYSQQKHNEQSLGYASTTKYSKTEMKNETDILKHKYVQTASNENDNESVNDTYDDKNDNEDENYDDDDDDDDDLEATELMRTLCAHFLPYGVDPSMPQLIQAIPDWDESDPNEAGYRIIRLTARQLSRVEAAFDQMIQGLKQKSEEELVEETGDATFARELLEVERLLDESEAANDDSGLPSVKAKAPMEVPSGSLSLNNENPRDDTSIEEDCHPSFPGVKSTGKGEMGDLEYFHLPIIFKSHVTGFEPTKDMALEPGNVVAGQYLVESELGSAAFSTAYRCIDLSSDIKDGHEEVCLKVIKNTKDFFDQSLDEIKILELLRQTGQVQENHVLEMKCFFYYREHLIIVTELLRQNLFEFGKFIIDNNEEAYFTLPRLAYITRQALIALRFVHSLGLVHSDIKPENILLSSYSRAQIKLIDFGSSCYLTDRQSSYIQSRSYRAPEVVLGLPYDGKIDVWSLGCVIAEMYTGEVTFINDSIVSMLSRIEAICGPFPRHMIAQGRQSARFFSKCGLLYEVVNESSNTATATGEEKSSQPYFDVFQPKSTRLSSRLGLGPDLMDDYVPTKRGPRWHRQVFCDFLRQLLTVDPDSRPDASEALEHPWMQYAATLTVEEIKYPGS